MIRAVPVSNNDDPSRAKLRIESDDPNSLKSIIDTADPSRANDRTESDDPK
jgi:hypothetical protein